MPSSPAHPGRTAFLLSSTGYRVSRDLSRRLKPLGLEARHFALLNGVATAAGTTQQALAERLQIPPSRVVALLDDLEARGLVERQPHPTDRRARAVRATETGQRVLHEARRQAAENEERILAPLDPSEREQLAELLERLDVDPGAHPVLRED